MFQKEEEVVSELDSQAVTEYVETKKAGGLFTQTDINGHRVWGYLFTPRDLPVLCFNDPTLVCGKNSDKLHVRVDVLSGHEPYKVLHTKIDVLYGPCYAWEHDQFVIMARSAVEELLSTSTSLAVFSATAAHRDIAPTVEEGI